jgi:glycosyltransferase involved in cell wall biosynthesis
MSKQKETITFIIPTIGRPSLEKSINSLIKQTNPNWECIIIFDDVDLISFDDERIKCLKIKKSGQTGKSHNMGGLVRNEGIKICDTKWIGFLDDDDTLHPQYVQKLYENYQTYDLVIWKMKFNNGKIVPKSTTIKDLRRANVGISFCYQNKFDNLLFNNSEIEDFEFIQKIKNMTKNIVITPEIYYNVKH